MTAHSGTFLEEVFRPEQGRSDSAWVGHPGLEEVPGQVGMAHGGTAPTWEEQQEPRLGTRVSRGVALQKVLCHVSLPARFGARERRYWRQSWQAPQLAASAGGRGESRGPEKIRDECYIARCLSFERS